VFKEPKVTDPDVANVNIPFKWEMKFINGKWMETKICKLCKQEKDLNLFYRNHSMKDGHLNKCKVCHDSTDKYKLRKKRTK
jgi:hypothetical protein